MKEKVKLAVVIFQVFLLMLLVFLVIVGYLPTYISSDLAYMILTICVIFAAIISPISFVYTIIYLAKQEDVSKIRKLRWKIGFTVVTAINSYIYISIFLFGMYSYLG